jgi:biopolymer transport protein TolR
MRRPLHTTPMELNLAPMVDVMMCLLIFFMVATKMVQQETSSIDLPPARSARELDSALLADRLVINIRAAADPAAAPTYLIREQPLDETSVVELIAREAAANAQLNCVLRADKSVHYRYIEDVLAGCLASGVQNIAFSAATEETTP